MLEDEYENDDNYEEAYAGACENVKSNVLSNKRIEWEGDIVVPNPLVGFCNVIPQLQQVCASMIPQKHRNFVPTSTIWEGECSGQFKDIVDEFRTIMSYDYMPIPVKKRQDELSKNYAAPLVAFLNGEITGWNGYSVLIVGAGEGKDVRRVIMANPRATKVVCVEPDSARLTNLKKEYPDAIVYNNYAGKSLEFMRRNGPYDLIIMNMSVHYVLGVGSGKQVLEVLGASLTERGLLYGSYVDIESVKQSGTSIHLKHGHSVVYLGTEVVADYGGEEATLGIARVSMSGRIFRDPIITTEGVYDMFGLHAPHLSVVVYDGHTMIFGPGDANPVYDRPDFMHPKLTPRRNEITFYRAIIANRSFSAKHPDVIMEGPPSLRSEYGTGVTERYSSCAYNKGAPLQNKELQYLTNSWVGPKHDGTMCKIIHVGRSLEVVLADEINEGQVFKYAGYTSPCDEDFILQGEFIKVDEKYCVIATDVLVAPWGLTGTFASRWRWLSHLFNKYPGKWPFTLQYWTHINSSDCLSIIAMSKEGVVIQSLDALGGAIKEGRGAASYVKRVKTIDVKRGGKIIEQTLEGQYVRDRNDRVRPNPPSVIRMVKESVGYAEFSLFMRMKFDSQTVGPMGSLIRLVAYKVPVAQWRKEDAIHFHHAQFDPILEAVDPDYLSMLRMEFVATCVRRAPVEALVLGISDDMVDEPSRCLVDDDGVSDMVEGERDVLVPPLGGDEQVFDLVDVEGLCPQFIDLLDFEKWMNEYRIDGYVVDHYRPLIEKEHAYQQLQRDWGDRARYVQEKVVKDIYEFVRSAGAATLDDISRVMGERHFISRKLKQMCDRRRLVRYGDYYKINV